MEKALPKQKLEQKAPFSEKATPKQPFLEKKLDQKTASAEELKNLGQKSAVKIGQKPVAEAAGKYAFKKEPPKQAFEKSHVAKTGGGGIKESLAKFYYFFEDGYYSLMDKINSAVPVYKVIDPIDKVFPSFILFAAVIIVILFLIAGFFLFPVISEKAVVTITLKKADSDEKLSDYEVVLLVNGEKDTYKTDSNSQIVLKEVDLNSTIKVEVSDVPGYEDFEELFRVTEKEFSFTVELKKEEVIPPDDDRTSKLVKFKDSETESFVREFLKATFDCSKDNSSLEVIGEHGLSKSTSEGMVGIKLNEEECGDVLVSVQVSRYIDIEDEVLPSDNIILLTKEEIPELTKGTIFIKVFDEIDGLIQDRMKFFLFEESDPLNAVFGYDNLSIFDGLKEFDISPGNYFIKVFDANTGSPKYSCDNPSETKELLAGEEIILDVTCIKASPEDVISIEVVDKNTQMPVQADIELRKASSLEQVAVQENSSSANFAVSEDLEYIAIVSAENYLPYEGEDVLSKGDFLKVELIELSEQTTGKAKITVYNSGGNKASSGTVFLRYADGALKDLRTSYFSSIGFRGEVLLEGIKPGNYYAEAFISNEKGFSQTKAVDENSLTEFTVNMQKIRGDVEFNITKAGTSFEIISFDVNFFDAVSKERIPESEYTFNSKNNNYSLDEGEYYAVISKQDYHSTRTKTFLVVAKGKIIVNTALPKLSGESIKIEFIGLFKENGNSVNSIELGKEYSAEFSVAVDPNMFYFNFLIGTGNTQHMNNDSIFVSSFTNLFDTAKAKKTTSFTGNYNTDFSSNLTSGNAKAVLVEFYDFDKREFVETAFTVPVKIKLKEDILDADSLVLFFKAMAVGGTEAQPSYYLDPEDLREFTSLEEYTYSNNKTETLSICSDSFCHAFLIESSSAEPSCAVINHGSVSSLRLDCFYSLSSFILNNDSDYDDVTFTLDSVSVPSNPNNAVPLDAIIFNNYEIKTKENTFSGTANKSFFEEVFGLKFGSIISTNANLTPTALAKTTDGVPAIRTMLHVLNEIDMNFHEIRIRSDLNLNLNILDPENMEIEPFTKTPLAVEVLDGKGDPVEYAMVTVKITDSAQPENDPTLHASIETDEFGQVLFAGPEAVKGLYPNSIVEIIAEFNDINAVKSIQVNDINTFAVYPEELVYGFFPLETELKSKDLNFVDLSNNLLDQRINSFSVNFVSGDSFIKDSVFEGFENIQFTSEGITIPLSLSIDANKSKDLSSNLLIEGSLDLIIKVGAFFADSSIPVSVLINSYSDYLTAYFNQYEVSSENPVVVSMFSDESFSSSEFVLAKKSGVNVGLIEIYETDVLTESIFLDKEKIKESFELNKGRTIQSSLSFDLNAVLNPVTALTIAEKKTEKGELRFTFIADKRLDLLVVPFEVEILPSTEVLAFSPNELRYIFSADKNELQTKTLNLKSSFSTYPVEISEIVFELEEDFASAYSLNLSYPVAVTEEGADFDFSVSLTRKGMTPLLKASELVEGNIYLNYSVKGRPLTQVIPVKVFILSSEETIKSEFFDLKACIGEGGYHDSYQDFWIGCNIGESGIITSQECSTEKPKISLNWNFQSFSVQEFQESEKYNGIGACSKPNIDFTDYNYCDAAQFSMELVNRIIAFKGDDPYKEGFFDFKATLMQDKFSPELFSDFDFWAMNSSWLDTPSKYNKEKENTVDPHEYNLVRFYFAEENAISFIEPGSSAERNSKEISVPGWYDVNVQVETDRLIVRFTLIESSVDLEPKMNSEDSVFYYIPFDGFLAADKGFDRKNYGSSFDVSSFKEEFTVNNSIGGDGYKISDSDSFEGYRILSIREYEDFNSLYSSAYPGTLMELSMGTSGETEKLRKIKFYPSYATPAVLKAVLPALTQAQEAGIYYYVSSENEKQLVESDTLIEWQGLGNSCYDFSDNTLLKDSAFSDEKATQQDIAGYENVFKLFWSPVLSTGTTFLRSIFYSPAETQSRFNIISYMDDPFEEVSLYSIDNESTADIPLDGIQGVEFNSRTANQNPYANSLKAVFELIDSEYACVKNQGNFTYILWNKEKLYEDLYETEFSLDIESECITQTGSSPPSTPATG